MKVIVVKPAMAPTVEEIGCNLRAMQKTVGGLIEEIFPWESDPDVALICNEEGKLQHLTPNRAIYDDEGHMLDIIFGTFFICYAPIESENFESIPEELIEKYIKKFSF